MGEGDRFGPAAWVRTAAVVGRLAEQRADLNFGVSVGDWGCERPSSGSCEGWSEVPVQDPPLRLGASK